MCDYPIIVFVGAGRVGKTSILRRFMYGAFHETYMETVEDIHLYHFNETGKPLFVNFFRYSREYSIPSHEKAVYIKGTSVCTCLLNYRRKFIPGS